jgi:hypothetical protein
VQEFAGYERGLRVLSGRDATGALTESDIRAALDQVRTHLKAFLADQGPIDQPRLMETYWAVFVPGLREAYPAGANHIVAHIGAFLRPFRFFPVQIAPLLGVSWDDLTPTDAVLWEADINWAQFILFRYEDLSTAFPLLAARVGLEEARLPADNVSSSKPMATEIEAACAGWEQDQELRELITGRYTTTFGYDRRPEPSRAVAVAQAVMP